MHVCICTVVYNSMSAQHWHKCYRYIAQGWTNFQHSPTGWREWWCISKKLCVENGRGEQKGSFSATISIFVQNKNATIFFPCLCGTNSKTSCIFRFCGGLRLPSKYCMSMSLFSLGEEGMESNFRQWSQDDGAAFFRSSHPNWGSIQKTATREKGDPNKHIPKNISKQINKWVFINSWKTI